MRVRAVLAGATLVLTSCGGDFIFGPPPGSRLAFLTQPATGEGQVALAPAIRVALQDSTGATLTTASDEVTIALAANSAGATLSGATTVRAVNGIATFTNLRVDLPGDGFVLEARRPKMTPVASAAFSVRLTFAQVSAGQAHTCGLTVAGFAYCWGANESNQLGSGDTTEHRAPWPVKGGLRFGQIDTGDHHACGATTDHVAYCWGFNLNGRLGDGTTLDRPEPTRVTGDLAFTEVSTATYPTCGLTVDGSVYCWGMMFAENTIVVRHAPAPVPGGGRFLRISVGAGHACGVATDSTAYCWGSNTIGKLGDSTTTSRLTPAPVAGGLKFAQVSAGYAHTCGVTIDNTAYCWGWGGDGNLGDGTSASHFSPTPVAGGVAFAQVSAGDFWHSCGVSTGNAAYCWGRGDDGQLGDSTTGSRLSPTPVVGGVAFVRISAGIYHSCGISSSNVAYCWGSNQHGQLGDATTAAQRLGPTPVAH